MLGVPGLGLDKKTGYLEAISGFPQFKTNAGLRPQITPRRFFTRPIQFIIQHQLSNNAKQSDIMVAQPNTSMSRRVFRDEGRAGLARIDSLKNNQFYYSPLSLQRPMANPSSYGH